jgi:hypothetical protein
MIFYSVLVSRLSQSRSMGIRDVGVDRLVNSSCGRKLMLGGRT